MFFGADMFRVKTNAGSVLRMGVKWSGARSPGLEVRDPDQGGEALRSDSRR